MHGHRRPIRPVTDSLRMVLCSFQPVSPDVSWCDLSRAYRLAVGMEGAGAVVVFDLVMGQSGGGVTENFLDSWGGRCIICRCCVSYNRRHECFCALGETPVLVTPRNVKVRYQIILISQLSCFLSYLCFSLDLGSG